MADRKSSNKYYPPEWNPSKGSINKFRGQHPLRERARKLSQGILIIRFEMPFPVWCLGCKRHLGKGTRYNAEKKAAGKFYSTTIYEFKMKCPSCSQYIVIKTDPENTDFVVISGAKKKNEEFGGGEIVETEEQLLERRSDPLRMLEIRAKDHEVSRTQLPKLNSLKQYTDWRSKDDFKMSQLLRKKFRDEKKERIKKKELIQRKRNSGKMAPFDLLPITKQDIEISNKVRFLNHSRNLKKVKQNSVSSHSIFSNSNEYGRKNNLNQKRNENISLQKIAQRVELKNLQSIIIQPNRYLVHRSRGSKLFQNQRNQRNQKNQRNQGNQKSSWN